MSQIFTVQEMERKVQRMTFAKSSLRQLASAAFAVLLIMPGARAAPAGQQLAQSQSSIKFVSKQMGVPVEGHFKRFNVVSQFDPKKPDTSSVTIDVDLSSVDIGNPDTENELKKPGWFDSARRPIATFKSQLVKAVAPDRFEVHGTLSIKGQTQKVVVPVQIIQKPGLTTAKGTVQIKRMDFRIGDGEWNDVSIVANDVQINFQLALLGVPAI